MDEIAVIDSIKKSISQREQQIQETLMSGGCLLYTSPSPRDS